MYIGSRTEFGKENHINNGNKLELIPNGIDIEAVRSAIAKGRKEIGIDDEAYIVGMVGRLTPQKAPDTFIHAAKLQISLYIKKLLADYYAIFNNNCIDYNWMRSFPPCCFSMGCLPCLHIDYICEPNEKEGRKLLAEIMQCGNFGYYDERGKDMRSVECEVDSKL